MSARNISQNQLNIAQSPGGGGTITTSPAVQLFKQFCHGLRKSHRYSDYEYWSTEFVDKFFDPSAKLKIVFKSLPGGRLSNNTNSTNVSQVSSPTMTGNSHPNLERPSSSIHATTSTVDSQTKPAASYGKTTDNYNLISHFIFGRNC